MLQHLFKGVVAQILNQWRNCTMNTVALANEIEDERFEYLESTPLDTVKECCKQEGRQISNTYTEEYKLINDILEKVIKPTSIVAYGEYEDYIHLKKFAQRRISNSLLLLRCN